MKCDVKLQTSFQIIKKDPKYGVTVMARQVQLSYAYLTRIHPVSKNYQSDFIFPAKMLTAKSKKTLQEIATYLVKHNKELKQAELKPAKLNAIANLWLAIDKKGSFLKSEKDARDKVTKKIPEERKGSYCFKAKTTAKAKGDGFETVMALEFRNSSNDVLAPSEIDGEFYGGAIVNVVFQVTPYLYGGDWGFTAYLRGFQKIADSAKFGEGRNDFAEDTTFQDEGGDVAMGVEVV